MDTTDLAEAGVHAQSIAAELESRGEYPEVRYDLVTDTSVVRVGKSSLWLAMPAIGDRYRILRDGLWRLPLDAYRGEASVAEAAREFLGRVNGGL